MEQITVLKGTSPLLISVPHAGTLIPPEIKERMEPETLFLPDTDWFVDRLYAWAQVEGAGMIKTPWSRYVIDLNRPPDNEPLYDRPGSSLVPASTFCGMTIYRDGRAPNTEEVEQRLKLYWRPYHDRLAETLDEIRATHGHAVLLDAHSIRSVLPSLFEGELPHLNLGSNDGASAARSLVDAAWAPLQNSDYRAVRDGRFKGGYITRHYGRPDEGVHAMQLEIAQRAYMPEFPPQWDRARTSSLVTLLKKVVANLEAWKPDPTSAAG